MDATEFNLQTITNCEITLNIIEEGAESVV